MRLSRKWVRCCYCLLFGGAALILLGAAIDKKPVLFVGVLISTLSVLLGWLKCKCPYCGVPLIRYMQWGNNGHHRYCPGCGNEILYDDFEDLNQ